MGSLPGHGLRAQQPEKWAGMRNEPPTARISSDVLGPGTKQLTVIAPPYRTASSSHHHCLAAGASAASSVRVVWVIRFAPDWISALER